MTAKVWKRSSGREDKHLTDDRKSLIERYMIDAEEAQARTQRAAEEQARRAAEQARRAAAEEEAARRAAAEAAAKRAAEEAQRAAAEAAARRAAEEAQRAAAEAAARRAEPAAARTPQAVADAGLQVAALQPAGQPTAVRPVTDEDLAAAATAEPREQAEPERATLPIYRWFDAPARKREPDLNAFRVDRRAGSHSSERESPVGS